MERILFKELIQNHEADLKAEMMWENYDLNDTELIASELVKNHALKHLQRSYGTFRVYEDDVLDYLKADIFQYFPALLQQLSITRVITGMAVVPVDTLKETRTRTEKQEVKNETTENVTLGSKVNETNRSVGSGTSSVDINDTGTVTQDTSVSDIVTADTTITNTSNVEMTGVKSVNLSHYMPEQDIDGVTNDFPRDEQGTPILSTSTVQNAGESYTSTSPLSNNETSTQNQSTTGTTGTTGVTTNDLEKNQTSTSSENMENTRNVTNSGTDTSTNNSNGSMDNTVSETVEREATNAQYSYEINAFLESSVTHNAFRNWSNNFAWVIGIL